MPMLADGRHLARIQLIRRPCSLLWACYHWCAGMCSARYLNAPRVEDFVVEKIRDRILTEETIVELVTLVAEEIDAMAGELSGRLDVIDAELGDVQSRLQRLYEALETSELTLEGRPESSR